jgi:hypothetical protein
MPSFLIFSPVLLEVCEASSYCEAKIESKVKSMTMMLALHVTFIYQNKNSG